MKTILLTFLIFFTLSCDSDDAEENTPFQPVEIETTLIGRNHLGGNGSENIVQSNLVINNTTAWQNLMTQMDSIPFAIYTDDFTETAIDFTNYIIIAVFLEVKPRGWAVEITSVIENETNITVSTEENFDDTLLVTQPYHIVKIPITTKPFIFE